MSHILHNGMNNSHEWVVWNSNAMMETNFQHRFTVNVWETEPVLCTYTLYKINWHNYSKIFPLKWDDIYYSVRKVNYLIFFARTWWISMKCTCKRQPWTFICMRGFFPAYQKYQYLTEVVFNAIHVIPVHPRLVTSDYGDHEVCVTVCGIQHVLRVLDVQAQPKTRHFHYNENPMRALNTTSFKCCLPSADATDRREKFTICMKV